MAKLRKQVYSWHPPLVGHDRKWVEPFMADLARLHAHDPEACKALLLRRFHDGTRRKAE